MPQTPEERRAYEVAYRNDQKNKELKREYDRKYRAKMSEEKKQENKERLKKYNGPNAVERTRKWREANPEKTKLIRITAQGRRRSAGEKHQFSVEDVLKLYGTCCHICGEEVDLDATRKAGTEGWQRSLWLDHVVALANGGGHTLENIRPSHAICNLRKSNT